MSWFPNPSLRKVFLFLNVHKFIMGPQMEKKKTYTHLVLTEL